jgi:hypothetical protein
MANERVALLGGTGPLGRGLARRLALAGYDVVVGSRDATRAATVAEALRAATGVAVAGALNGVALEGAAICVLAIPADGIETTLAALGPRLVGMLVVDVVVPLAMRDGVVEHAPPPGERSAGEMIQRLLPASAVVSAFKTMPAAALDGPRATVDGDVLVSGDDAAARARVAALVARIPALRAIDVGPLRTVRAVEGITALLVNLNRRHHARTAVRIVGL